jgi:hypothetical protein
MTAALSILGVALAGIAAVILAIPEARYRLSVR